MTGLITSKELSRRSFLKGGGALVVGFSLAGSRLAGKAGCRRPDREHRWGSPFASNLIDQNQVDAWLTINADNTGWIKSGAIFQGTGSTTGILMIAAEELDMDLSQLSIVQDDTDVTPNTGQKDASNTIVGGAGRGTRAAAAWARQTLLGLASTQLGVPVVEPYRQQGRRLGRRQVGHLRSVDRRQALPRDDAGELRPAARRRDLHERRALGWSAAGESRSASTEWSERARRGSTSRDRHGHVDVHPERSCPGDAPRSRRAAARPEGVRDRGADRLGRRGLDLAHSGRTSRAEG